MSLGYLEEVGPSEFRLGIRCISLAQAALGSHEIIQIAMPYLDALRNQVGESVNMAILDGTDIVYVVRLLNDDLVTMRLSVGSRLPAYSTSLGRAILAFLPEKESQAILDRSDIRAITSATLIHRTDIETALKHIRKEGYAYNGQGVAMGVHGIAAPVLGANGRPLAAINLSIARPLTEREVTRLASHIMSTAMQIAERGRELHAK
jgi:IclR family pca regulon transcriptional regulator